MKYLIAEKFKSLQGEGVYAGTPMAFIRFVGCSVGKKICQHCDTIFEKTLPWQGGGEFTAEELMDWSEPYTHICLTGGEPLDQNLSGFLSTASAYLKFVHVETSGTKKLGTSEALANWARRDRLWICVSPKPGFLEEAVLDADEVKVIVPGLGTPESLKFIQDGGPGQVNLPHAMRTLAHPLADRDTFRWPDIDDALRWAAAGKTVFIQPRNGVTEIDKHNLMICQDILKDHPQLRLSVQMHKVLHVQ